MEPETIEAYYRPRQLYYQPEPIWRPSLKLPTFNGKAEEWESFWIQFQTCARSCHFGNEEFATHLLISLKGSALSFATSLGYEVLQDAYQFSTALKSRYIYVVPAEIQRTALHSLRKTSTETLHDYASRVQSAMQKAYPDIHEKETFQQLTVEQFLNGYPDQDLAYDVQKFNPKTIEEATDRLVWMESCMQHTRKRPLVRKTTVDEDDRKLEEESLMRKQYVTEERFLQFERNMHSSMKTMLEDFAEKYFRKRQGATNRKNNCEGKSNNKETTSSVNQPNVTNTPRTDFTELYIPDITDRNYQTDEKKRKRLQIMLNRLSAINEQLQNEASTYSKEFNDADIMIDTYPELRDLIPTNQRQEGRHLSEDALTTTHLKVAYLPNYGPRDLEYLQREYPYRTFISG